MNCPMIGIVPLVDADRDSYWMLPGYMKGLTKAGGIPVMLPLSADRDTLTQLAKQLDGFLFSGGQDVAPAVYGEQPIPACGPLCPERDAMERALLPLVWEMDKPVLGICRGIQLLNAVLGGTLYQDLPTQTVSEVQHHQDPPYDKPVHEAALVEHTPLYMKLKRSRISVNSCHHQGIRELAPKLRAMAYAPDGMIEAVYAPDRTFVWAVQWHPEFFSVDDEISRTIFGAFVDAART